MQPTKIANTASAADMALLARNRQVYAWVLAAEKEQPSPPPMEPSAAAAPSSFNWPALAICETGGDEHMTGSTYSSMYGVLNQAIRENSPPDVAARILAGTASVQEQTDMAIALEKRHGIRSWSCWEAAVS